MKIIKDYIKKRIVSADYVLLILLVAVIFLLTPIVSAKDNIILDKSIYSIDDIVKITLVNVTLEETLSIISDKDVFKYSGELQDELQFYPRKIGAYIVRLSNGEIIDEAGFSVVENYVPNTPAQGVVYTDKNEYLVNEPVLIHINATGEYELAVISETEVFKFLDKVVPPLSFIPQTPGKYTVELRNNFMPIATTDFNVVEQLTSQSINLTIQNISDLSSIPQEISSPEETISPAPQLIETITEGSKNVILERAEDGSLGEFLNLTLPAKLELKDKRGIIKLPPIGILRAAGNNYDVVLFPGKAGIRNIKLNNLKITADKNIAFDEISLNKDDVKNIKKDFKEKRIIRSFFIDTSELNYTNGSISIIASGKELWKCKEWNSTMQTCLGAWIKIMDLTPGEEYAIPIAPEDPGYAETGVASINTKKPIYHPGENAEIIMVVLDTAGYLVSNADVTLTITAPDNTITTLTTSNGEIIETGKGIYETTYSNTVLEGNYSLEVKATGNNVNSTMFSYFTVKSYYEFDIIRDTPVTTDPWKGAFASSIRIISYASTATFNFTEALPDSFEITDSGGATITTSNNKTFLTWTNLNNNSVISYSALPPLITPELYELGPSFVSYDTGYGTVIFNEARPWYLAVDPVNNLLPDGDGNYIAWTIEGSTPAATRWDSVNDPVGTPDNGVTFINSTNSNTSRNSFTFQNLTWSGVTINSVNVTVVASRSAGAGGNASLQIFYRQGGTDYDNANTQNLTTTWTTYRLAGWNYVNNPATGSAWNESAINNMEWGVRRPAAGSSRLAWVTQMYVTVNYNVTNNVPNVTALNYPGNDSVVSSSTVQFNFTAIDDRGFLNCTLYTNVTGSWLANKSNTNVQNNTVNNITITMPDGNFRWNIRCWDNSSPSLDAWYAYNYTVHVNTIGPNTTLNRPANFANITNITYMLNSTSTDAVGVDTVTFLYRVNESDAWQFACSDADHAAPYNCTWSLAGLPDGKDYQIRAYANDTFGIIGNNDTRTNITVDTNGPNTVLDRPENFAKITTNTYSINATATDMTGVHTVRFFYRINATDTWKTICNDTTGPEYNCTWNVTALADSKTYEIRAYANDTFGKIGNNDTHTNITIDRTGPNTTINQPTNSTNITTNAYLLNATATDLTSVDTVTFVYRQNSTDTWNLACTNNTGEGTIYTCTWNVTTLPDGKTYEIRAYANDSLGNTGSNNTRYNITIDRTGPNTILYQPANFTNITTNTYKINATATDMTRVHTVTFLYRQNETDTWKTACNDTTGPEYNCTWNVTTLPDGKDYQIMAYANDTFGSLGNNDTHTNITIDRTGPTTILDQPANFTNITTGTYTLNATATDTITGVSIVTFLYRPNATATWTVACRDNTSPGPTYYCTWGLTGLPDRNSYQIRAYANDTLGTTGNNDTHTNITIDRAGPNITLSTPLDLGQSNSTVNFTYRVNDTLSNVSNCSLILNNDVIATNYSIQEGPLQYFYYRISLAGQYNWSINCTDSLGNINASVTRRVNIIRPDLIVTSGNISFSNNNPKEGENISINATVYNRGGSDALNVIIQFFLGNPGSGGTQINENITANMTEITGATPNGTFNVNWIVPGPGPFAIFVVIDPPTATNGSVNETNESNNKANNTIHIPSYNYFHGMVESNIYLGDLFNQSIYYYTGLLNATGNIFVTGKGSTVSFSSLQAMGRDINNNSARNDFNDTDTALNMTNYNDSIRKTWTANTDTPIATKSIIIFNRQINNIPIINSTNTINFVTGMLWDKNDGNTQYDGTQDLIFVTQINESKAGAYGTYDYEIRLPVNLKNYYGSGTSVEFYSEIT